MLLYSLGLSLFLLFAPGIESQDHPEWGSIFAQHKVEGCFMLYEVERGILHSYNPSRCVSKFPPASTFKVPNALIALETGVAADEQFMIPWDGEPKRMQSWEKDHTLASAMRVSCLPYYREIARRVGRERMADYLDRFQYGNQEIGEELDLFWLNGSLKISPADQMKFINALRAQRLPLSQRSMNIIKKIIQEPGKEERKVYAKTGWAQIYELNIGWIVGWVEKEGKEAVFVLNQERPLEESEGFGESRFAIRDSILSQMGW